MNFPILAAISIALLIIAWRMWQRLDTGGDHVIYQGVLLAVVTVGWFLRIVWGVGGNR